MQRFRCSQRFLTLIFRFSLSEKSDHLIVTNKLFLFWLKTGLNLIFHQFQVDTVQFLIEKINLTFEKFFRVIKSNGGHQIEPGNVLKKKWSKARHRKS